MAGLSISKAWDETKARIAADGRLMMVVAAAFLVLPALIVGVTMPTLTPDQLASGDFEWGLVVPVFLAMFVLSLIGYLAITRLALGPSVTVAESIGHAVRRVLPVIGALLLIFLAGVAVAFVVGLVSALLGTAGAVIASIVLVLLWLLVTVRLLPLMPVAVAEGRGPLRIIQRSWALTSGDWWRLFAFVVLFLIGAVVLILAVSSVLQVIGALLFGAPDPLHPGWLIFALIAQIISATVMVVFTVMVASIYGQLVGDGVERVSVPSSGT